MYANAISTIISGDGPYMFYCHFNNKTACEIILIKPNLVSKEIFLMHDAAINNIQPQLLYLKNMYMYLETLFSYQCQYVPEKYFSYYRRFF